MRDTFSDHFTSEIEIMLNEIDPGYLQRSTTMSAQIFRIQDMITVLKASASYIRPVSPGRQRAFSALIEWRTCPCTITLARSQTRLGTSQQGRSPELIVDLLVSYV